MRAGEQTLLVMPDTLMYESRERSDLARNPGVKNHHPSCLRRSERVLEGRLFRRPSIL